jgi:hypothetical protein
MSKINPDDGMEVGTVVVFVNADVGEDYTNGDYGTIIQDEGDEIPKVRFSDGKERWVILREIRPKTLNDATPAEWDKASKEPAQLDWVDEGAAALDKASKFAYAGDTTSMLGEQLDWVDEAKQHFDGTFIDSLDASQFIKSTIDSAVSTGIGVGKIAYVNVPTEDFVDSPAHYNQHSGGVKLDDGKSKADLVIGDFAKALKAIAEVGTFGAVKYTAKGWATVPDGQQRYANAAVRHYLDRKAGETIDPESGLLHKAHEAWNHLAELQFMLEAIEAKEETAMTEMTQRNL